jgi:hypothetical protein
MHQCKTTDECEEYMICRENNSTETTLGSFSVDREQRWKDKLCFCQEENMENIIEKNCNGGKSQTQETSTVLNIKSA